MIVELLPLRQKKEADTTLNIGYGQIQFVQAPLTVDGQSVAPTEKLDKATGDYQIMPPDELPAELNKGENKCLLDNLE